jgi:hypothetical protein
MITFRTTFKASVARVMAGVFFLAVLIPHSALACSVCYGEPDSPAAKGLTWAIVALGAVVGVVISGVVAFFVQANRHSAELHRRGISQG